MKGLKVRSKVAVFRILVESPQSTCTASPGFPSHPKSLTQIPSPKISLPKSLSQNPACLPTAPKTARTALYTESNAQEYVSSLTIPSPRIIYPLKHPARSYHVYIFHHVVAASLLQLHLPAMECVFFEMCIS